MKINTVILKELSKADSIVSGDRRYILDGVDSKFDIGDFIHLVYVSDNCYIEHKVSDYVYVITSTETLDNLTIVGIRKAIGWLTYVKEVLRKSHNDGYPCDIRFYGIDNCEHSLIRNFGDESVIVYSKNHNPIRRDISSIVEINRIVVGGGNT